MSPPRQRLTIERLGHRGEGVAPGPVFVPRALPGEIVEGAVENGRMSAPRILSPVSARVRPPCPHARRCGGCVLQHVRDDFVAEWKAGVIREALKARGLAAPLRRIATSPPGSRRRAVLTARRLKGGTLVGFHGWKSGEISEIGSCLLLRPELLDQLPLIRDLTRIGASRKGRLSIALTLLADGVDIAVSGGRAPGRELRQALVGRARRAENLVRLSWNDEVLASFAPARLRLGGVEVTLPPGAFLQATEAGEAALLDAVRDAVAGAGRLADLFAGAGSFTLPLARLAPVHAVEGNRAMIRALDSGWRAGRSLKQVTVEARDLFRRPLDPEELARFDAVVLDPPRAGAEAQMREIARAGVGRLALVSCNPVSFARDAQILCQAGFGIDWIDVIDQFRWSAHVELAACLSRRG